MTLLIKDADKLMLDQNVVIVTYHALERVLKQPPDRWLSNARMIHYQALLLNSTRITFHVPTVLNPAALLPDLDLEAPLHDCSGILAQACSIRPALKDAPISDAEVTWFTDGSSYVRNVQRYVEATVTTTEAIWAEPLP